VEGVKWPLTFESKKDMFLDRLSQMLPSEIADQYKSVKKKKKITCLTACPFSFLIISYVETLCQCIMKQLLNSIMIANM